MTQKGDFLGSGWAFPVSFSPGNYRLDTNRSDKNIDNNIHIIMLTALGERVFQPLFGSGLQEFIFHKIDETLKGSIIAAVKASLLQNEPRITVLNTDVLVEDARSGLVNVTIDYISNLTNTRHNYVFPFHLNEGTTLS